MLFSKLSAYKRLPSFFSIIIVLLAVISILPNYYVVAAQLDHLDDRCTEVSLSTGSLALEISETDLTIEEGKTGSVKITNIGSLSGNLYAKSNLPINGQFESDWKLIQNLDPDEELILGIGGEKSGLYNLDLRLVQDNCEQEGFIDYKSVYLTIAGETKPDISWPDLDEVIDIKDPYYLTDPYYYGDYGGLSDAVVYVNYSQTLPFDSKKLTEHLKEILPTLNSSSDLQVKEATYVEGKGVKLVLSASSVIKRLNLMANFNWYKPDGGYGGHFSLPYQSFITYGRRIFLSNDYFPYNKPGVNTDSVLNLADKKTVSTRVLTSLNGDTDPQAGINEGELPASVLEKLSFQVSNDAFKTTLTGDILTIEQVRPTTDPASLTMFYNGKMVLTRKIEPSTAFRMATPIHDGLMVNDEAGEEIITEVVEELEISNNLSNETEIISENSELSEDSIEKNDLE